MDSNTTKENEMTAKTEDLIAKLTADHKAAGTSVKCPECGMGIGKFCRTTHGKAVIHSMRVELANAQ